MARDLSREALEEREVASASVIAFYLPMHTATRLALPVICRVRRLNPTARIVAYGLYAPLSRAVLREHGVEAVLGPEAEGDLVALAEGKTNGHVTRDIPRLAFVTPDRTSLPLLARYAT